MWRLIKRSSSHEGRNPPCECEYGMRRLTIQWHITERCNLKCQHCYRAGTASEPNFDQLLDTVGQVTELHQHLQNQQSGGLCLQINLTGGEPFLHADFLRLLEELKRQSIRFGILTNGTLIDKELAAYLAQLEPAYVQVSIDGNEAVHDQIRGAGGYAKAISGLKNLVQMQVRSMISFTAHRGNIESFSDVVDVAVRMGVPKVWVDRMVPIGAGAQLQSELLTSEETKAFFGEVAKVKRDLLGKKLKTHVAMQRSLQFLVAGGKPYSCSAGKSLVCLLPNGDVLPCRRLPVVAGNLDRESLRAIYEESEEFRSLREAELLNERCLNCMYKRFCRGGSKCLSHALHAKHNERDPGCWLPSKGGRPV